MSLLSSIRLVVGEYIGYPLAIPQNVHRLLLHTETPDGGVVPVWEEAHSDAVAVLKDVMASRRNSHDVELIYGRIPITAERPPDFTDLTELINVTLRSSNTTPIVVNCQLGRGRSTLASVRNTSTNLVYS